MTLLYMLMRDVTEVWVCISYMRQLEVSGSAGWEDWSLRAKDREDGNQWEWSAMSKSERTVWDYMMAQFRRSP